MTDRDKAVQLIRRELWLADQCTHAKSHWDEAATSLLDQIAPLLTAQAVAEERAACTEELRLAVAAARSEERERCAKVADKQASLSRTNDYDSGWGRAAERIAAAIRKQEVQG